MFTASSLRPLLTLPAAALVVSLAACGDSGSTGTQTGTDTESATSEGPGTSGSTSGATTGTSSSSGTTVGPSTTTDPGTTGSTVDPTTGSATTGEPVMVTAFRWDTMKIEDPHFFALNCGIDITDQINPMLADAVTMDTDADGSLDLNFVLLMPDPLDQAPPGGDMQLALAQKCVPPITNAFCNLNGGMLSDTAFTNADACLAPDPNHVNYGLSTEPVPGPCFTTDQIPMLTLDIGGFGLPLRDVEISAQYDGDPADGLMSGIMRGFLTETDGQNTFLPEDIALVGGSSIAELVCKGEDLDDNNGEPGWWFYVSFTAQTATWLGD